jgi:hypothetical protein
LANKIEKFQMKFSKEEKFLDKLVRIRELQSMTFPIRFLMLLLMNPRISIALIFRKILARARR